MNLAISDFLIMSEMPIFVFNSIHRGPALGEQGKHPGFSASSNKIVVVCRYYGFIGGLSGTVSICSLAAISFDRYYVIKFPLNMRFTKFRAKICVIITWIYGVVFSAIPLLNIGLGSYVPEGYLTSCSYDYLTDNYNARLFIFVFFIAAWLIPFVLIFYCYTAIMSVVKAQKKMKITGAESSKHVKQEEKKKQEVKLALLVFIVIALWFAAWTPYSVVSLLGICGRKDLIQPFYSMIPALFCKTASCADPFVYALIHPRFKAEIMKMFFKSNTGVSRKIFSSDTTRWRNRSSRRKTLDSTCLDDDEPEIEMITIENVRAVTTKGICRQSSIADENEMRDYKKPPWWYRPSFNDRFSSIRYLQRSISKGSQKEQQDGSDDEHTSI